MAFNINNNYGIQEKGIETHEINNASADNAAVLRELADAQKKMSEFAPKIADAIAELREAIEKKDQKTVRQKLAELTSGTAAEMLKGVLVAAESSALLHYLGWG